MRLEHFSSGHTYEIDADLENNCIDCWIEGKTLYLSKTEARDLASALNLAVDELLEEENG